MSEHKAAVEVLKRKLDYLNAEREVLEAQTDELNDQINGLQDEIDSIEATVAELTSPMYKASFTFDGVDWGVVSGLMAHPNPTSVIQNGRN